MLGFSSYLGELVCGANRLGGCVKVRFTQIWLIWSLSMVMDLGGCHQTRVEESSRHLVKYPTPVSFLHGDRAGDPSVACRNMMRLKLLRLELEAWGVAGELYMFAMGEMGEGGALKFFVTGGGRDL